MQLSFRQRLLLSFSGIILLMSAGLILGYRLYELRIQYMAYYQKLGEAHSLTLQGFRTFDAFLGNDKFNSQFFQTGRSSFLNAHNVFLDSSLLVIGELDAYQESLGYASLSLQDSFSVHLRAYQNFVQKYSKLVKQRGYKNYGVVGTLRHHAHKLETFSNADWVIRHVLQLRRNEKDYLLRQDPTYIDKLTIEAAQFRKKITISSSLTARSKDSLYHHLTQYLTNFHKVVTYDVGLGYTDHGLKDKLDDQRARLDEILIQRKKYTKEYLITLDHKIDTYLLIIFASMILLGLISSLYLSKKLSYRLFKLSKAVSQYVKSGFDKDAGNFSEIDVQDEIGKLGKDFHLLKEHLTDHLSLIQQHKNEADRANMAKTLFLGNISHEIRTPLNGIIGMTELMLKTDLNEDQFEYANLIHLSSDALLNIVTDILDFSRIEQGTLELRKSKFDLRKEIEMVHGLMSQKAASKGLQFHTDIMMDIPSYFIGDARRFKQVLMNLLSNAVKFTEEGKIHMKIYSKHVSMNTYEILVEVIDTGIGVNPSIKDHIFQSFSQADTSSTRQHGGTGIGLAISQHLVGMMGGKIDFHSQEGLGSKFWFTLRLEAVLDGEVEQEGKATKTEIAPKKRVTNPSTGETKDKSQNLDILIVEDNPINQKITKRILENLGHTTTIAQNGRIGVEKFEQGKFDLIFMDIQMPEMDGIEAARRIRTHNEKNDVYIIAFTANATEEYRNMCFEVGMNDFITKPISLEQLNTALEKVHVHNQVHIK